MHKDSVSPLISHPKKKKKKIKHLSIYIIIIYIKSKLLKPTQFSMSAQYLNKIIILFKYDYFCLVQTSQ